MTYIASAKTRAGRYRQVYNNKAVRTSHGGLFKKDLVMNKRGKIVSKRASKASKRNFKRSKLKRYMFS